MMIQTAIVATNHLGAGAVRGIIGLDKGEPIILRWENNPHDANAVACFSPNGTMVGYIPRSHPQQRAIADALKVGKPVRASILLEGIVDQGKVTFPPKISVNW